MRTLLLFCIALAFTASFVAADDDYYVELLKMDVKAEKMELINEAMNLSDAQAKKFWPVYKKYQKEMDKINDQDLQLLKKYADNYDDMSDDVAKGLVHKAIELDIARSYLRKKYFREFAYATDGITAAKFFQIENRLGLLIELQIASVLPILEEPYLR